MCVTPSILNREEHAAQFTKEQARARYISRISLQRNPHHPSEADQKKIGRISQHNALIAQDLARGAKERYCCAEDVRQMLRQALRRDVKFYGRGLGVYEGYSVRQIKRILEG